MAVEESQIYRDLMRLKPEELTPNAWAVRSGVSRTVWADMRRHGNPSRRTLEKLLSAAGSSLAEFEALRIEDAPDRGPPTTASELGDVRARQWSGAPLPPIPLVASDFGGEWGEASPGIELITVRHGQILDRLPRPPGLASDQDAYALTTIGDSMWPRFRPGRRLVASPGSPVAIGDDVLVQLTTAGNEALEGGIRAMIKELVRRTGSHVELRQFNPDVTFRVPASEIAAIHKVMGELL